MCRKENTTKNSYSAKIFERSSFRVNQYMVWSGLEFPFFFQILQWVLDYQDGYRFSKKFLRIEKKAPQSSVIMILAYPAVACNVIKYLNLFHKFCYREVLIIDNQN